MNKLRSKQAQHIQDILSVNGLAHHVVEFPTSTHTAQDAANSIGCEIDQIVNSLLFKTKNMQQPILILVSGAHRVNEKCVENYLGEKILKADADFVQNITGFSIGGIPPIGHKQTIETILIDEHLMKHSTLWAAAGTPRAVFSLSPDDLTKLTQGRLLKLAL